MTIKTGFFWFLNAATRKVVMTNHNSIRPSLGQALHFTVSCLDLHLEPIQQYVSLSPMLDMGIATRSSLPEKVEFNEVTMAEFGYLLLQDLQQV